uniref:Ig-like domain-containing protein n=2 Tax=Ornithorhynchus anatinus TaxID=9258 RepID=F6ZBI3_ORNAN
MLLLLLTLFWGRSISQTLEFALRVPESVTVEEGLCVSIPCTFTYPERYKNNHTAYGYWFQKKDKSKKELVATNKYELNKQWRRRGRFHLIGDLQRDECSLRISDANVRDNGRFMFRVEKGSSLKYLYKEHQVNVMVTALTQEPKIHLPAILESGQWVTLNCTASWACEQATPPTFFWTAPVFSPSRNPPWRSSPGPPFFSVLPLTLGPQYHGTNLTCHVTFPGANVTTRSTVRLNVSYAPENMTFTVHRMNRSDIALSSSGNASSLTVLEGEHLRLACAAESNPPATLSWSHEGLGLGLSPSPDPGVLNLDLPRVAVRDEGKYTCQAQHPLGSRWISLHLSVHFPPRLVNSSCSRDVEGLHCSCAILANPPPALRWWVGGQPVSGNSSGRDHLVTSSGSGLWANSTLRLRGVLEPGLRLLCEGTNPHGTHGLTILLASDTKPLITNAFTNGVTLAAIGGAGVMTLLSLCLILLIMKILRKKKEATGSGVTESQGIAKVDYTDLQEVTGSDVTESQGITKDQPWEAEPGSPLDLPPPADLSSDEARIEELHYASLTFLGLKPRETQASREPSTEYSEIKFR